MTALSGMLLAMALSAQLPVMTFDTCRDAAFYAGAAAESRDAGVPMLEVLNRDLRAADSAADLSLRIDGLRVGYDTDLTPDAAAAAAFHACILTSHHRSSP